MEQLVARWAHNPEVAGSNPAHATIMKMIFKLFLLVLMTIVFSEAMAGDSTSISATTSSDEPVWQLIVSLLIVAIEIAFRLIPTAKDYSILNFLFRILNFMVPNKSVETKYDPNVKKRIVNKIFKIKAD